MPRFHKLVSWIFQKVSQTRFCASFGISWVAVQIHKVDALKRLRVSSFGREHEGHSFSCYYCCGSETPFWHIYSFQKTYQTLIHPTWMCWDGPKKFVANISSNPSGVLCGPVVELIPPLFLHIESTDTESLELSEIHSAEDIMVRRQHL